MWRGILFTLLILFLTEFANGECPTIIYSASDSLCINENTAFENSSVDADSYYWDFCLGDYESTPNQNDLQTISGISASQAYRIFEDSGQYFGFATSRTNNTIFRLDFGENPKNIPIAVNLGNPGNLLASPEGFDIIKFNGNWYAFIGYLNNGGNITRLDFGSSLSNIPTASNAGNFVAGRIRDLRLLVQNDSLIMIFPYYNENKIYRINYRDSVNNSIDPEHIIIDAIAGSNLPTGLEISNICGQWYAHMISLGNNNIQQLNFGSDIMSAPVVEWSQTFPSILKPYRISVVQEGHQFFAAISNETAAMSLIDLNDLDPVNLPIELDNSLFPSLTNVMNIDFQGEKFIQGVSGTTLKQLVFRNECGQNIDWSNEENPSGIKYNTPGNKKISLKGIHANGDSKTLIDSIYVTNNESPEISYTTNGNACLDNVTDFAGVSTDNISSWNWDFGDGNTDQGQSVSYQYGTDGNYLLKLNIVSENNCTNQIKDSIVIYAPPVASFDLPTNNICTNTSLLFTNTSQGVDSDSIKFIWNYNNEGTSSDQDGSYLFSESGNKTIILTTEITGCIDSVAHIVDINSGPFVEYAWTKNCWDKTLQQSNPHFINQSDSVDITFEWDFGNGDSNSVTWEPNYIYSIEDTFLVSLKVESIVNGCSSIKSDSLIVSSEPLATFIFDTLIVENLVTDFLGLDLTNQKDSIIAWEWKIGANIFDNEKNTTYIFEDPGIYPVSLSTISIQNCPFDTIQNISVNESQYPVPLFSLDDSICISEPVTLFNTSINTSKYYWDFCLGDYESMPILSDIITIPDISSSQAFRIFEDGGQFFGFATSRTNNSFFRLDFGESLNNFPIITNLGNPGNLLDAPEGFDIVKFNGNWFAFIGYLNNGGNITRLDFGSSLTNIPVATNAGNFVPGRIRDLRLVIQNNNLIMVFPYYNENKIYRINYRDSVNNAIDPEHIIIDDVPGSNLPSGIDLNYVSGQWVAHLVSLGNNNLQQLNFGTDMLSTPLVQWSETFSSVEKPYRISIAQEGGNYYAAISNETSPFALINLNDFDPANSPTEFDNILFPSVSNIMNIDFQGKKIIQGISGTTLKLLTFSNDCGQSMNWSNEKTPAGLKYDSTGYKSIALKGYHENGNVTAFVDSIYVRGDIAPNITLTTNGNICFTEFTEFTGLSPDSISSWNWDFGDGNSDQGQVVSYQFGTEGTYPVKLSVEASNFCNNTISQEISIYNPPIAIFSVADTLLCSNNALTFQNQSIYSSPDSITTFLWNFDDTGSSNAKDTVYSFDSGGDKNITLTASIPGCDIDTVQTFNIIDGPLTDFLVSDICNQETAIFNNLSSGNIIEYNWDFGDGYTSTLEDPTHLYDSTGTYLISLFAKNNEGCNNEASKTLEVHYIPIVDFTNELACNLSDVPFFDQSTVEQANISTWDWQYQSLANGTDSGQNSIQNPVFNFMEYGNYEISLIAGSNYGCYDTVSQIIEIFPAPVASFSFGPNCLGDTTFLVDESSIDLGYQISNWQWDLNNEMFNEQNPGYLYPDPGEYEIQLTVRANNLCEGRTSKSIIIDPLPVALFDYKNVCLNETTILTSQASSQTDPIESLIWLIEDSIFYGPEYSLRFPESDIYSISHFVLTEKGCTDSLKQELQILEAPVAAFVASPDYGAAQLEVAFTSGTQADSYLWTFGDGKTSNDKNPGHIFTETGGFQSELKVTNDNGCYDSMYTYINVVEPNLYLNLDKVTMNSNPDRYNFILDIANPGTILIDDMDIVINVNGEYQINERFEYILYAGEEISYPLDFELINNPNQQPQFICFELIPNLSANNDSNPGRTQECLTWDNGFLMLEPYPNPVTEELNLSIILPEKGDISLRLQSSDGKIQWFQTVKDTKPGLNSIKILLQENPAGVYVLEVGYGGIVESRRIVIVK